MSDSHSPALAAVDLVKTYPGARGKARIRALDGLSINVRAGSVFALLGPNGAGKSTAVKILATLSRPDSGHASVAGIDVLRNPDGVRRIIGLVSQKSSSDPMATARENLVLAGRIQGMSSSSARARAADLLARFALDDAAHRLAKTFSGGMARKLDVAIGLMHRPQVLFLDEPTTGLDPQARTELWAEIGRLSAHEQVAVLLTTHYLDEADQLADRLAIVDHGRVVVEGTPEQLKAELRGDTVQVELATADSIPAALVLLSRIADLRDVAAVGASLRARASSGARAVPVCSVRARGCRYRGVVSDRRAPLTGRRLPAPRGSQFRGGGMTSTVAEVSTSTPDSFQRRGERGRLLQHSAYLTGRSLRTLWRQPTFAAMTLIAPIIWLLLFGQLFRSVVHIPGFSTGSGSYLEFITPGVIVMTALFSSGWAGTVYIDDMNRGVMDRLLASPVRRGAMMIGTLAYQAVTTVVQTLIVFGVAYISGARFRGGLVGVVITHRCCCTDLRHHGLVLQCTGVAAPPAGSPDRSQPVHRVAVAVPVVGDHGYPALTGLGATRRPLQPGRLGSGRLAAGAVGRDAVGCGLAAAGIPRGAGRDDGLAGHQGVSELPGVDLRSVIAARSRRLAQLQESLSS